ncbi:hypothetical protein [Streptomyces sp. GbtcB6]|uniref:hypothetical protein n=1 Tax=Streptomyces sp. GbtcB6 TaxID=2824751 RepID=UPI001C2FFD48|nr:hypothetical protein [Streptomyces sp. GbtcB6]
MGPREKLSEGETGQLEQVRLACPELARAGNLTRVFQDLVRSHRGHLLWSGSASASTPSSPTTPTPGVQQWWKAEDRVNRVKPLKQATHGRVSFRLLHIRILTGP